jgi:hypothetical protein
VVIILSIVFGLVMVGFGIHCILRWAERRGYVYYLDKSKRSAPPIGLLAQIYKPEMEYVVEEEASQHVRGEEDESGRGGDDDPEE